jgi:hypothetical protein
MKNFWITRYKKREQKQKVDAAINKVVQMVLQKRMFQKRIGGRWVSVPKP